eukprot:TRINITY_DN3352_c0_g1_i1.p1 TRINITY_DN3352_c0_g1~~TRINITY_DN3352_c0_g1_i1.p1  ORF type:complete len:198 (-),score=18.54 TRINITY_DN3352_c0_g1_i1:100-693(-)
MMDRMMGGGLGGMGNMLEGFDELSRKAASCPQGVNSSATTYYCSAPGPNNQPIVVQKSSSTRQAGNVREHKESHADSRTGVERMSVQRSLGDRARKIIRGRSKHSGEQVQDDICINMDSSEGGAFDQAWEQAASRAGLSGDKHQFGYQPEVKMGLSHQSHRRRSGGQRLPERMAQHSIKEGRDSQRAIGTPNSTRPW